MLSDKNALKYFVQLQDKLKPTIAIEVGAYDADFSKSISSKNIKTYAFEASPYVYEKYKNDMKNISYINKAVVNYDGYIEFKFNGDQLPKENVSNNSIKSRSIFEIVESAEVPCVSLNSYFSDLKDEKIVLWIDCEGANKEVLQGSSEILSMTDSIFIEVETYPFWTDIWLQTEVEEYLKGYGFVPLIEFYAYAHQKNVIFIKDKFKDLF